MTVRAPVGVCTRHADFLMFLVCPHPLVWSHLLVCPHLIPLSRDRKGEHDACLPFRAAAVTAALTTVRLDSRTAGWDESAANRSRWVSSWLVAGPSAPQP